MLAHRVEERRVALRIRLLRRREIPDRSAGEEEGEERAGARQRQPAGQPALLDLRSQERLEERSAGLELGVWRAPLDLGEHRQASRRREGIPRERSGLINGAGGSHLLHQLPRAAVGADRQSASEDFAERGQVGPHAVDLLGATRRDAEPRDDFVEDEERAVTPREVATRLEVSRRGRHEPHVGRNRLDHERRDLPRKLRERRFERRCVVVRHDRRQRGDLLRDSRASGDAEGRDPRARRNEEPVGMAVVSPVGLHDALPARGASGQTHRAHRGFRPRVDEAHHLDRRHELRDLLGETDLELGRSAVGRPSPRGPVERPAQKRRRMSEEVRPVRHDVVQVPPAVRIADPAAPAGRHEEGLPADGRE